MRISPSVSFRDRRLRRELSSAGLAPPARAVPSHHRERRTRRRRVRFTRARVPLAERVTETSTRARPRDRRRVFSWKSPDALVRVSLRRGVTRRGRARTVRAPRPRARWGPSGTPSASSSSPPRSLATRLERGSGSASDPPPAPLPRANSHPPRASHFARIGASDGPRRDRASRPGWDAPPPRPPRLTHHPLDSPARPPSRRNALAAVEIDFGGGLFERIEVALADDPVSVARDFCNDKGFSSTIVVPLAVKLAQARDKARRERRAVRQGRPLTAKPAMQSTLTAKSKARLEAMRAARPASAAAAGSAFDRRVERPPPVKYDPNKQFHSSAKIEFGRDDRAFAPRGRPGEGASARSPPPPPGKRRRIRIRSRVGVVQEVRLRRWPREAEPRAEREGGAARARGARGARETRERAGRASQGEGGLRGWAPPGGEGPEIFDKLYGAAVRKAEKAAELERMKKAAEKAAEKEAKKQRASVMSRVSREMMRNRTAGEYATYNERLYAEAAQRAEAKKIAQARAAEEKERQELEEITGAPNISHYAHSLVRPEAAWDRLTEGYAEKFVALAKIKKDMEKKELGECTFRPKINGKSKTMMRSRVDALRDRGLSHHEQLYFDANRRQMRAEELKEWRPAENTFHPNAHKEGRFDERTGELIPPKVNPDDVVDRLQAYAVLSTLQKERLEKAMYGDLGKPNVGRPPEISRAPSDLPIHEELYAARHEFDDKRELIRMRDDQRLREEAAAAKTSSRSEGLAGALKRRTFRKMFAALDREGAVAGGSQGGGPRKAGGVQPRGKASGVPRKRRGDARRRPSRRRADRQPRAAAGADQARRASGASRRSRRGSGPPPPPPPPPPRRRRAARSLLPAAADDRGRSRRRGSVQGPRGRGRVHRRDGAGAREGEVRSPRGGGGHARGTRASKAEAAAAAAGAAVAARREDDKKYSAAQARTKRLNDARQRKLGVRSSAPIHEKLLAEGKRQQAKLEQLVAAARWEESMEGARLRRRRARRWGTRTAAGVGPRTASLTRRPGGDPFAAPGENPEVGSPGSAVPGDPRRLTGGEAVRGSRRELGCSPSARGRRPRERGGPREDARESAGGAVGRTRSPRWRRTTTRTSVDARGGGGRSVRYFISRDVFRRRRFAIASRLMN